MNIIYKDSGLIENYSIKDELKNCLDLRTNSVLIHFWQLNAVLLGKLDTLLPEFQKGLDYLISLDYKVDVRKQGGLAIVSDVDNLNISFCFKTSDSKDLHKPYQYVANYISQALKGLGLKVDIRSIDDSYCPGDYDLSVNDLKFAGIAQYRNKESIIVSVSLFVRGDQKKRSQVIKDFYQIAEASKSTKQTYPDIDVYSMTTLSELLHQDISIDVVKEVLQKPEIHICE